MARILVVDDEPDLCEILQFNLTAYGYDVDVAYCAEEALEFDLSKYDMLLLDVMMDKMSGFSMASIIRKNPATAKVPIIFCTAKDTENDMLTGFNVGADDYILKPYRVSEVAARVKAVLNRYNNSNNNNVSGTTTEEVAAEETGSDHIIGYETLKVNLDDRSVSVDGEDICLTRKEYDLLVLLMSHRGRVFSREQILEKVWSDDMTVMTRSVDVNIARLRKKLKEYAECIVSRSGYGYTFRD